MYLFEIRTFFISAQLLFKWLEKSFIDVLDSLIDVRVRFLFYMFGIVCLWIIIDEEYFPKPRNKRCSLFWCTLMSRSE